MSKNSDVKNIYQLNGKVPLGIAVPFGIQHILAMFVPNIAPITILFGIISGAGKAGNVQVAALIQACMFCAGAGTMAQCVSFGGVVGSGLPVVMGISFTFLAACIHIGTTYGYAGLAGAVIVGGCIEGLIGQTAKHWRKYIPEVVSGSVVMAIGISIFSVGVNSFGGGGNYLSYFASPQCVSIGFVTLISCLVYQCTLKGVKKQLNVLFALVTGYFFAIFVDVFWPIMENGAAIKLVDFTKITSAIANNAATNRLSLGGIVALPQILPGGLEFHLDAIVEITIVFLVSAVETIGDTTTLVRLGCERDIKDGEISGSLGADGFMSAFAGLFGCSPITSFSQNVGLVGMTKVVNRFTVGTGATILLLCGLVPALGGVFSTIPDPVLGGCTIIMFGTIMTGGIGMIARAGLDARNTIIVALSCSFGIGIDFVDLIPDIGFLDDVFNNNMVAGVFVFAFILNLVLPKSEVLEVQK